VVRKKAKASSSRNKKSRDIDESRDSPTDKNIYVREQIHQKAKICAAIENVSIKSLAERLFERYFEEVGM
jgi:hypothetical protein